MTRLPSQKLPLLLAACIFTLGVCHAQLFHQDSPVTVKTNLQLDNVDCIIKNKKILTESYSIVIDAPLTIMKDWASPQKQRVFWANPWGNDWYTGGTITAGTALDHVDYEAWTQVQTPSTLPNMWPDGYPTMYSPHHYGEIDPFIMSIYKIGVHDGDVANLLAFVHLEGFDVAGSGGDRNYALGIASSHDNGYTWKYLGDIIQPKWDSQTDMDPCVTTNVYESNIGGGPYVVVKDHGEDYFYVYFNEHTDPSTVPRKYFNQFPAVARARVSDIINDINSGAANTLWHKWNPTKSDPWSEPAISANTTPVGEGAPIIYPTPSKCFDGFFDMHAKAAYCAPLKKYFLLANQVDISTPPFSDKVVLFSSADGLAWSKPTTLDSSLMDHSAGSYRPFYAAFSSLGAEASDDNSVIGRVFNVVWSRDLASGLDYPPSISVVDPVTGETTHLSNQNLMSKRVIAYPTRGSTINLLLSN